MTEQLDQYMQLLKLSYSDAVAELLQKYGPAKDSYFAEDNYQAFLVGKTYSLPKNAAIDRTAEGLIATILMKVGISTWPIRR